MSAALVLIAAAFAQEAVIVQAPRGGAEARPALPPLPRHPVSLDLVQAEVAPLLRHMASSGDLDIVLADGVSGRVTVQVEDLPWEDCLALILLAAGLEGQRVGERLIVVAPLTATPRPPAPAPRR